MRDLIWSMLMMVLGIIGGGCIGYGLGLRAARK